MKNITRKYVPSRSGLMDFEPVSIDSGTVEATSPGVGMGSSFTVTLPAAGDGASATKAEATE